MGKVTLASENGISTITLNRPERFNALDAETMQQLLEIMKAVQNNNDHIVILTGAGKAFSAGGDITMMKQMGTIEQFNGMMELVGEVTMRQFTMNKIVISAVNGSAAGLGLSIALNADYVVANEEAKFGVLFAGIGLIPDGGGHFFLEQRMGALRAKEFIWGLEQVKGEQAKRYGLVDVLTEGDAKDAALHLGKKLLQSPLLAVIETKMIYHDKLKEDLRYYLNREQEGQLKLRQSEDHREGVAAFLEKRKPNFKGK